MAAQGIPPPTDHFAILAADPWPDLENTMFRSAHLDLTLSLPLPIG
ncbi:MAG: hypothetical protein WDN30_02545 [Pararobbsia sp.]